MQVKRTNLSDTKFKLSIVPTATEIDSVKQATLKHLGTKHVKLSGFRAGKAPLNLIEKNVDPNLLQSEFLEEAVNRFSLKAIQEENIRPIAQPKVTLQKFVPFTQLEFDIEIEAIGDIKLASLKVPGLKKETVKVEAKEVNEVLASLQQRMAERQASDQPAKEGDETVIDFKGTDSKGEPVNGAEGFDYPLILGSNAFIPGFEPQLVGMKAGESKKFDVTFPKDYGVAALKSKKVTFEVKVRKVNKLTEPKLDDTFAAKAGPFKTLANLKADIKKQLSIERQQQADRDYENNLIKEIASKSKISVPDQLIEDQVMHSEEQERQNLAYRGQTWQEHLKEEGVTEEEHRKRNRPEAELAVKAGLVLSAIAEQEGIKVTPEEVDIRIQLLKGQYQDPTMQAELDKDENKQEIANRILTEKTIAKVVEINKK